MVPENGELKPADFNRDGKKLQIKEDCLLGEIRKLHMNKQNSTPKLAICITMYNESKDEFKRTLRGVLMSYVYMLRDQDLKFHK